MQSKRGIKMFRKKNILIIILTAILVLVTCISVYSQDRPKIAVVAITSIASNCSWQSDSSLSIATTDLMVNALVNSNRFRLFERAKLDAICKEHGFQNFSGLVDQSTAVQLGKMIGVRAIVTGTITNVNFSADSVFQIAAHEKIYPLEKLYKMCKIARNGILIGKHRVGRVIARPFIGDKNGEFERTGHRKDFSVNPPSSTIIDLLTAHNIPVIGVGKIEDLFNFNGITESIHTPHNSEAMATILLFADTVDKGLIFANLPDFDTLWGHRNNYNAFAEGLEKFDRWLPELFDRLAETDVIIFTADHGCDPTTESTDHSREYIPIIVYGKSIKNGADIGVRKTFADIGATIADIFRIQGTGKGTSFWNEVN